MIAAIRLLNLARLRQRPLRTGLTILAVASGVALFVAVLVARASAFGALAGFDEERSGPAPLEVVGSSTIAGLDEDVLPLVELTDGVKAAVPLVQAVTIAEGTDGEQVYIVALGVDCRVEAVVGRFGCAESGGLAGPVVGPSLARAVGRDGLIRTNRGRIPLDELPAVDQLEQINHGWVAVFPLAEAQEQFTRAHAYDTILVLPDPGVSVDDVRHRLEGVVGEHNVVRRTDAATKVDMPLLPMFLLVGLLSLVLGAQLAHNAVALSLEERRRDLAVSGALGASGRVVFVGTLVETGILGLVGGILGVVGGIVAARPLVDGLSGFVERSAGVDVAVSVPPAVVGLGLLLGVGVAVAGTIGPARRAVRADIAGELQARGATRTDDVPHRGRRAALFFAAGFVGLALAWVGQSDGAVEPWQPTACLVGVLVAMFMPLRGTVHAAAPLLGTLAARVPRLRRGLLGVAVDNLVGDARRAGTATLVVAAAVTVAVAIGGIQQSLPAGAEHFFAHDAPGVIDVGTVRQTNNAAIAARVPLEIRQRIESSPGVARVSGNYFVPVIHPSLPVELAVESRDGPPYGTFPIVEGEPDATVLRRDEVRIGPAVARSLDLDVGDSFELPGRSGFARLRVGSIVVEDGEMGRAVVLPYERFEELFGQQAPTSLFVLPEDGMDVDDLAAQLRSDLAGVDPGIRVLSPEEIATDGVEEFRAYLTPFWALQRSLMVVAFVAALSTLLLVGLQRRREYGVLSAVGMAPASLGRMVMVEAGLTGALGTVFGAVVGLFGLVAIWLVGVVSVGVSSPFRFDPTAPLLYGAITTAFVVVGAALPAWRAARLDPTVALRYE